MSQRVLILGGGISGLATAYYLAQRGVSAAIVEASPRVGGLIQTGVINGCRLEAGPDSFVASKPAVTNLVNELPELSGQVIASNDSARRIFIVKDGQLVPMPQGMVMMVPGDWDSLLASTLFPPETKQRYQAELDFQPRERSGDVSIAEFVRDHFDEVVLEYLTEPLLAGVYGGDARLMSASSVLPRFLEYERTYGSLIRGVMQERSAAKPTGALFLSFRNGMQALTDAVWNAIRDRVPLLHGAAIAVERSGSGWRVQVNGDWLDAQEIVSALPAHRGAELLEQSAPALAAELAAIPYTSAITAMLVYDRAHITHPLDGFGFLVPRGERRRVAAATWVNTKFPIRVADGYVALRAFIVDRDADELLQRPDDDILRVVRDEFARLMGIEAAPAFHTLHRWPRSMPQYVVGHGARWSRIRQLLAEQPGLSLVGNAYDGIGIPDCVRLARAAAERFAA